MSSKRIGAVAAVWLLTACGPGPQQQEETAAVDAPSAGATPGAAARPATEGNDVEWRFYGGNLASQRYSPLEQIDASNAGQLKIAWRFNTGNYGPRPEARNETTPLMIDGVLYTQAGITRNVVAIDAEERRAPVGLAARRRRATLRARAAQDVGPRSCLLDVTAPATSACWS